MCSNRQQRLTVNSKLSFLEQKPAQVTNYLVPSPSTWSLPFDVYLAQCTVRLFSVQQHVPLQLIVSLTVTHQCVQAIRCVVFLVCYPFLKYTGYSITLRKAAVMVWAGLRGAVGLALSMFLLFDGRVSDRSFRLLAFFFMGMIAAITILVQGTTTSWLLEVRSCGGVLFMPSFDLIAGMLERLGSSNLAKADQSIHRSFVNKRELRTGRSGPFEGRKRSTDMVAIWC